ncbi:tRNA 5-hydroxyuridine methyltransferase [Sporomusa carbonis]|uniref:O-methyltransferase n=1 Tax=Sporomusa carbonis TaxID=3076075 RepID=UPI003A7A17BA
MDKLSNILSVMEDYAVKHGIPILSKENGKLLQEVASAIQPASVLEIGTAIGYSTLLLTATIASGGKITTIEQNTERIEIARQFLSQAGVLNQVEIIAGDAGQIVSRLAGYFDLVFIDAAKGQYLDYLHKVMDKLSPGAVVIADNVLFRGWVSDDKVPPKRFRTIVKRLRAYLDFVDSDPRFKTTIWHIGDGMAVSYYQGETKT